MPNPRENRGTDAPMKKRINRRRKKVCVFCADSTNVIDYKDANKLKRFVSERGKILPRRITGTCANIREHLQLQLREQDRLQSYLTHLINYI